MRTWIYKGNRKENTYLYIKEKDDFGSVPDSLLGLLGDLEFVLTVELTEEKKLAQASASEVMTQLEEEGYYLQLPPADLKPERLC